MTPQEYALKLRLLIAQLKSENAPLRIAANATHAEMSNRIFRKGEAADQAAIGSYSTADIWINPSKTKVKNQGGFSPLTGKNGDTEFKSNPSRQRKTSYFKGWKGLRNAQGLPNEKVDLNFVGDMRSDFNTFIASQTSYQVNVNEYEFRFNRDINNKKASGAEDRFNKDIFAFSKKEIAFFVDIANKEFIRLFNQ